MRPVTSACAWIGARDLLDIGGGIDRGEQTAAAQIRGNDLGDAVRGIGIARSAGGEIGKRDRHRLNIRLGNVEGDGPGTARRDQHSGRRGGAERERGATAQWQGMHLVLACCRKHRNGPAINHQRPRAD
jgi:hypothetical protein